MGNCAELRDPTQSYNTNKQATLSGHVEDENDAHQVSSGLRPIPPPRLDSGPLGLVGGGRRRKEGEGGRGMRMEEREASGKQF